MCLFPSWQESYDKPRQRIEKQRRHFADKGPHNLFHGHVRLWELGRKEDRVLKNRCLWTVVLEKTLESPSDSDEIKPVNLKGNQPWIFIGRTDATPEVPAFWSPDANSWLLGEDPDAGKDWRQKEKRATEDEMVGWHHWFNGHELGQTLGDGEGQGSPTCCSLWGQEESDTTWWLNNISRARGWRGSFTRSGSGLCEIFIRLYYFFNFI